MHVWSSALQIGAGVAVRKLLVLGLMSVVVDQVSVVPTALPMLAASLIM